VPFRRRLVAHRAHGAAATRHARWYLLYYVLAGTAPQPAATNSFYYRLLK